MPAFNLAPARRAGYSRGAGEGMIMEGMTREASRGSGWLRGRAATVRGRLAAAVGLGEVSGILLVLLTGLLARVADQAIFRHASLSSLLPLFGAALGVIFLRAAVTAAARRAAFACASSVKKDLRTRCVRRMEALGPLALTGMRAGEIAHVTVDAVEALDGYFSKYLPQRAIASLLPFTILAVVFPLDWISGLVLILTAAFLPVSMIVIGDQAHERNQRLWGRLAQMSGRFLDILQGLSTVRMFGAARREMAEIERASGDYRTLTLSVLRVAFLSSFMLELISAVSIAIVAVISGVRLLHGTMAFGTAWFILLAAPEYFLTLRALGTFYHSRMEAMSAAAQVEAFLGNGDDGSGRREPARGRPCPADRAPALVFRDVTFSYGPVPLLRGLNIQVGPAERVALAGHSGAGKSTLISLLLGFARPQAGSIEVDGLPLGDLDLEQWRRLVAWLPQRPTLFHGTVRDNVLLGRFSASETEVRKAMELARISELALDAPVGEAGQGVSSGQAQRIALARLFLRSSARVVLLDEPTAHLDPRSAALVSESIQELSRGRTTMVVTHREQTAAGMDRLITMPEGRPA
jgi:ATP-binding cassette subfamily C protein CydD